MDCTVAVEGDLSGATVADASTTCAGTAVTTADVWYLFHTGTDTLLTIGMLPGTGAGVGVEVVEACGGAVLACANDGQVEALAVTADRELLVRVFAVDPLASTFSLCISGVEHTAVIGMEEAAFSMYPNPSDGNFRVVVPEGGEGMVLTVHDAAGRLVHARRASLQAGVPLEVAISPRPAPGYHILRLVGARRTLVRPVLFR